MSCAAVVFAEAVFRFYAAVLGWYSVAGLDGGRRGEDFAGEEAKGSGGRSCRRRDKTFGSIGYLRAETGYGFSLTRFAPVGFRRRS